MPSQSFSWASLRRAAEVGAGVLAALSAWELCLQPIAGQLRVPPRPNVAREVDDAGTMGARLDPGGVSWWYLPLYLIVPVVAAAHLAAIWTERRTDAPPYGGIFPRSAFAGAFVAAAWLVGVFLLAPLRTSPFIYFKF